MSVVIIIALAALAPLLALVSYVERVYTEMGKFLSREFQENIEIFEQRVEPRLGVARNRAALSMSILAQVITAAIAVLSAFAVLHDSTYHSFEIA